MAIDKIWVLAEAGDAGPTPITLELLTEARSVAGTVEAVAWGADTASMAAALGEYGATTVYDVGDLGGALPGVPVASAIAALVQGGNAPDAILIPATYDGRDVAGRLSAKLDVPVLTNVTGLVAGDSLSSQHPIFGGNQTVTATLHRQRPRHLRHPGQVVHGRVGRRRGGQRGGGAARRRRCHQHGQDHRAPCRGAQRAQAGRGPGGGLGRPWPGRGRPTTP